LPFLKHLEGYVYIFFVNFSVVNFLFVYNSTKELRNAI
jgi:hypothetical protein